MTDLSNDDQRPTTWRRVISIFAIAMLIALTFTFTARAESPSTAPATNASIEVVTDQWFRIYIGEANVGWTQILVTSERDDRGTLIFKNSTRLNIAVDRGGIALKVAVDSTYTETADGKPIKSVIRKKLGEHAIEEEMYFRGDRGERGVELVTRQLGNMRREKLPGVVPAGANDNMRAWVSSREAERLVREAMKRGEKRIEICTLEPAAGAQVIRTITTYEGEIEMDSRGKRIKAEIYRQEVEGRPGTGGKVFVDQDKNVIQMEQSVPPGLTIRLVASDASAMNAKVDKVETIANSFIKADVSIPDARKIKRGVYLIESSGDPIGRDRQKFVPISAGAQQVIETPTKSGRAFRIEVDLTAPKWISEGDADWPTAETRKASTMLDFEDVEVAALAKKVQLQGDKSPLDKARKIGQFVAKFIVKKDYSIGFASASEVARTRRGDCTEHGVLVAALLRGAGVPSRIVSGLVYAPEAEGMKNVFVYHMWAQAWVEDNAAPGEKPRGRWVDVDAAVPESDFDAAHIALAASALTETSPIESSVEYTLAALGTIKIQVLEPAR